MKTIPKLFTWVGLVMAISLAALLPVAISFAQSVSFSPATNFTVGTAPWPVAIGDLNGDGKLDLAVANQGSNNVSILLGDGTGAFGAATNFTVGLRPYSVAIGDLNGDGKPDLATANYNSGNVSILLGTGTGTFGSATNLPVGAPTWIGDLPQSVAIGDLNGDGKLDLAVAKPFGSIVSILLGDGNGTFGLATDFPVPPWARSVAIGDFNGDGKPDLATANVHSSASNVSILLGDGTGAFGSAINSAVLPNPVDVAIGDFNGDGKLDLAVANANTNKVSVLIGVGNGTFGAATNFTVVSGSWSVAVGDLNGDDKPDLAVVNSTTNKVSVLLGDGTGAFGAAMNFNVGPNPHGVAIGDLNGDGKLDLAVTNAVSNNVSILLNTTVSPNQPPVANAGPDQTVEATSPSGASVTLNGSGSSDPDGDVLTYNWTGLFGAVSGVIPTVTLPLGTHTLTLTVSDGQATATDTVYITVQDTTPPTIAASATAGGYPYTAGAWTNQNVVVSFTCSDTASGIASCGPTPQGVSGEGAGQSRTGTAVDNAGNSASATVSDINIDKTLPTVTYSGNAGTYTVDQTVNITCSAADALSGIASDTCQNISGPAYSFSLETNPLSATATDKADNVGSGSTSFTVIVTYDSLCNLVKQFVAQQGIANSLCVKLKNAAAAEARGNLNAKAGLLGAFVNEVQAQSGKAMTTEHAATLIQLAKAL